MISVKFPFYVKYFDVFEEEAIVVNLTEQGGQISERQCVDIAFMLLAKENLENIMVYNPDRADTHRLKELLFKRKESFVRIEEVLDYEV